MEEVKSVARRFIEESKKGNSEIYRELLAPGYVLHYVGSPEPRGRKTREYIARVMLAAFPELHFTIEDLVAEDDRVVARITMRGVHSGDFQGIPGTGKEVSGTEIVIFRIAAGRIVEEWTNLDSMDFMQQLGLAPVVSEGSKGERGSLRKQVHIPPGSTTT